MTFLGGGSFAISSFDYFIMNFFDTILLFVPGLHSVNSCLIALQYNLNPGKAVVEFLTPKVIDDINNKVNKTFMDGKLESGIEQTVVLYRYSLAMTCNTTVEINFLIFLYCKPNTCVSHFYSMSQI